MSPIAVQCTKCSAPVDSAQRFCGNCGSAVNSTVYCTSCGSQMQAGQAFCGNCGKGAGQASSAPTPAMVQAGIPPHVLAGLKQYYVDEFQRIYSSGETYKGKWNWAAFFFGAIWAITKGLWLPTVICIIVALFTGGIGGIVYWFIFGARGNYMYYVKQVRDKDVAA